MLIENVVGRDVQNVAPRNAEMADLDKKVQIAAERAAVLPTLRNIYVSPELVFTLSAGEKERLLRSLGHETPKSVEKKTKKPRGRDASLVQKLVEMGDDYIYVRKESGKWTIKSVSSLDEGIGLVDKDGGKVWSNIVTDDNERLGYVYPEDTFATLRPAVGTKKTVLSRSRRRKVRDQDLEVYNDTDTNIRFTVGPRKEKPTEKKTSKSTMRVVSLNIADNRVLYRYVRYTDMSGAVVSDNLLSIPGDDNILRSPTAARNRDQRINFSLYFHTRKNEDVEVKNHVDTEVRFTVAEMDAIADKYLLVQFERLVESKVYQDHKVNGSRYSHRPATETIDLQTRLSWMQ